MPNFDKDQAVRRLINTALATDAEMRRLFHEALEDRTSPNFSFLHEDLALVLEAYANQRLTNAVWPCIDHAEFKAEIPQIAHRYERLPELHATRIGDFICKALLIPRSIPWLGK